MSKRFISYISSTHRISTFGFSSKILGKDYIQASYLYDDDVLMTWNGKFEMSNLTDPLQTHIIYGKPPEVHVVDNIALHKIYKLKTNKTKVDLYCTSDQYWCMLYEKHMIKWQNTYDIYPGQSVVIYDKLHRKFIQDHITHKETNIAYEYRNNPQVTERTPVKMVHLKMQTPFFIQSTHPQAVHLSIPTICCSKDFNINNSYDHV